MIKLLKHHIHLLLTAALLLVSAGVSADVTIDDLTGEDREKFDQFRYLFLNGEPEPFYAYAKEYEKDLRSKNYMMLYYKLKNNEGFYALRHNMVFRAMQYARELDNEIREDGAKEYAYLPTGLMGDIYNACHDTRKAETYFVQALEEVGDKDPKFTMRTYMNMAEMLSLKNPDRALEWMDKSLLLAKQTNNVEYYSMSLAMKSYILFLKGDAKTFGEVYDEYHSLKDKNYPGFSPRYANIVEVGRLAFNKDYKGAFDKIHEGNLAVDSSVVVVSIYAMQGDLDNGLQALKRRYVEMDSIYGLAQDANFDQLATESILVRSQEEATANKRLVRQLTNWLIVLILVFLFIYIAGRRHLMKKIWRRNGELKNALAKAEESDRMKSAFISSMSHEIRTPLNAVAGFSQLLCNPDFQLSDEERTDMQQRIASNVNLITSIVTEVLELSKSESEGALQEVEKTDVACNELCRSVLDSVRGKEHTGVDLRFSSNVGDNFVIRSNAYRLRSALSHLLDNAQKFTDMGYIELRCQHRGDDVLFSVTDTGVGIAAKDHERIFETFAKVDDFKEGIGLGLPICRRLVTSLGGTLEIDSTYTQGSRFVITLPKD